MAAAASAAKKAKIDLYHHKHIGVNLLEAVDYHVRLLVEPETMKDPPRNQNMEFMQKKDNDFNRGWMISYLAEFPNNNAGINLWTALEEA